MQEADDAYSRGSDDLADGRFAEAVAHFTQAIDTDRVNRFETTAVCN